MCAVAGLWRGLFDAIREDGAPLDADVDGNGRANAAALHDFTANPRSVGQAGDLEWIVDRAVACGDNHGMAGAKAELGGELAEVCDVFEFTGRIGSAQGEGPVSLGAGSCGAGEMDDDGGNALSSDRVNECKCFR